MELVRARVLTVQHQGRARQRPHQLALAGDQGLEQHDRRVVVAPGVHLAVGVPPLLRELVPGLGLGQQLADGALAQPQHVLGEQPLPDVVDAEQLAHPPRVPERVERLARGLLHVVAQHLLQPRLHRVRLRDPGGGGEQRRQHGRGAVGGEGRQGGGAGGLEAGQVPGRGLLRLHGRGGVRVPGAQRARLAGGLGPARPAAVDDGVAGAGGERPLRGLGLAGGGGARGGGRPRGVRGLGLLDVGGQRGPPAAGEALQAGQLGRER